VNQPESHHGAKFPSASQVGLRLKLRLCIKLLHVLLTDQSIDLVFSYYGNSFSGAVNQPLLQQIDPLKKFL
jgi:hypothetical protein